MGKMLFSVEQAFVGRDEEIRAPLKTPAWEAMWSVDLRDLEISIILDTLRTFFTRRKEECFIRMEIRQ